MYLVVDTLFIILFLLSPVLLVIGLVKPKLFSKLLKRDITRKTATGLSLTLGMVSFIGALITVESPQTTNTQAEQISVPDQPSADTFQVVEQETEAPENQTGSTSESSNGGNNTFTEQPVKSTGQLTAVIRVIDGDTIEIEGGQKVRYIGIDTPETVHPSEPVGCYGVEASNKNKELVLNKEVRLEKDISETDIYGRLLRYVFVGDLMVNELLVREGYAQSSSYPPDIKYQHKFIEAQRLAREEGKGLWGSICDNWDNSTPTTSTTNDSSGGSFVCDCSKTCSKTIKSCEEAQYLLNTCGCSARDGDKDGIACDGSPLNCQN